MSNTRSRAAYALVLAFLFFTVGALAADPLEPLVRQYLDESKARSKMTPSEENAFLRDWLDVLLPATIENPASPHFEHAMIHAMSIANALEDYALSTILTVEVRDRRPDDTAWQLRWENELAEMQLLQYHQTKDEEALEGALKSFSKVRKLTNDDLPNTLATPQDAVRYVANMYRYGQVLSGTLADHASSAALNHEVRVLLSDLQAESYAQLSGLAYDVETFATEEMKSYYALGDLANAELALEALTRVEILRWPVSHHFGRGARIAFPTGGEEYQAYVEKWIGSHRVDEGTPYLLVELALDYMRTGKEYEAYALFSDTWAKYRQSLIEQDLIKLANYPAGAAMGYSPTILDALIRLSLKFSALQAAEGYLVEFGTYFPDDPRYQLLTKLIEQHKTHESRELKVLTSETKPLSAITGTQTGSGQGGLVLSPDEAAADIEENGVRSSPRSMPTVAGAMVVLAGIVAAGVVWRVSKSRERSASHHT